MTVLLALPEAPSLLAMLPCSVWAYDSAHRLTFANAAAWASAGLRPDQLPPGTRLADALLLLAHRGMLGHGDPAALAAEQLHQDRSKPLRRLLRRTDGQVYDVRQTPLPGGGFVILLSNVSALTATGEEAQAQARRLDDVLVRLHAGLALYDSDHRLVLSNAAYERLLGLPRGLLAPGTRYSDLLRELARRGEFANTDPKALLAARARVDRGRPHRHERVRPNGQTLQMESQPVAEGGWLVEVTDISAVKRAEDEARARAAALDGVLESLPLGVMVIGPDQRVSLLNNGYNRIFAGSEAAVGEHRGEVARRRALAGDYGPGDPEALAAASLVPFGTGFMTRQRTRPNGAVIEIRTGPMPDGGHVHVVTDITPLHHAQMEASQRASLLQVMLDNMRHGIVLFDAEQCVVSANAMTAELIGLPPGSLRPGVSLAALQDMQAAAGEFGDAAETATMVADRTHVDRRQAHCYTRRRSNGAVLDVFSDPAPDGGFVVTYSDITELSQAQAEAQARAGILEVMLDNIRHGIVLFDAWHCIVAINPVVLQLLDFPADALAPGMTLKIFAQRLAAHGEFGEGPAAVARANEVIEFDRRQANRIVRTRANGRVMEVVSDPTPDGGFVLTYTDVTEDRRVRAELDAARAAAEAANLAKSRFLATMTHELRTPLNAVIGFAEALQTAPDPQRAGEYLRSINEAGRHLLSLIDDILDVTRAETTGFSVAEGEVDLAPLCESVVRVMRAAAASGQVRLGLALDPGLPAVRADDVRLRQVLLNLLSNAVKFTPAGGSVTLLAGLAADGALLIRVRDTGIGVKAEDMPRAFQLFSQLDSSLSRRFPGSGLGLYLSRALAEAQGATLSLESGEEEGTIAVLRFPPDRLLPAMADGVATLSPVFAP